MGLAVVPWHHHQLCWLPLRSPVRQGKATFAIYLPSCLALSRSPTAPRRSCQRGEGHILFVDDETELANLAQAMLTRLGYDTEALYQ